MITAIIVDDEPDCCESLVMLLERWCPGVKVLDICYGAETAIQSIIEHAPQILFLDIEMPFMNGFEMLEKLGNINFQLIFTTSYDQYAIRAIRFSALDYLLKPVDRDELQQAVQKAAQRNNISTSSTTGHVVAKVSASIKSYYKNCYPNDGGISIPCN